MLASDTGITAAIIGLITGIVTNIDRIYPATREILGFPSREVNTLSGEWTGLFKEFRASSGKDEISEESVHIKVRYKKVMGTLRAMRAFRRLRDIKGEYHHDFLVFYYFIGEPGRVGTVATVLKGQAPGGLLKGYWLGYDPEKDKIVAAPYVLTRELDIDKAKADYKSWLEQPLSFGS